MSNHKNDNFDEIDLNDLSTFFNSIGDSIGKLLYNVIQYFKRNVIFLLLAFIVGGGVGYFYSSKNVSENNPQMIISQEGGNEFVKNEAVVVLNYGSYDYLKNLIAGYNQDILLLKKGLINVQLEGIEDLSDLKSNAFALSVLSSKVDKKEELFALDLVDKNYHYHTLRVIAVNSFDFDSFFNEVQQTIESTDFIKQRKGIALKNLELRKVELEKSIEQGGEIFTKGVTLNRENAVIDLLLGKDKLIKELGKVELSLLEGQQALFKVHSSSQIIEKNAGNKDLFGKVSEERSVKKDIVKGGILFIFIFIVVNGLIGLYRRYRKQVNELN